MYWETVGSGVTTAGSVSSLNLLVTLVGFTPTLVFTLCSAVSAAPKALVETTAVATMGAQAQRTANFVKRIISPGNRLGPQDLKPKLRFPDGNCSSRLY